MLEPITKKMTDESDGGTYCFTFYCDVCGRPWHSNPFYSMTDSGSGRAAHELERDYIAAFERANCEAMMNFNRCPVCKKFVCNECFRILPESDMCKECAEARTSASDK